ncbi:MAG: hypothetical protein JO039_03855 [Solirubrobacterales bacterium]|nr:hypothetical protein [Solirubrobacterales bacterium]
MPHRPALAGLPWARYRLRRASALALCGLAVAGCTQPGSQAPKAQAAKLSHATGDISLACGYAQELTAFGGPNQPGVGTQESMALEGAHLLVSVWSHNPMWVYQGETISGVVSDSISLLGNCGLTRAQGYLRHTTTSR